MTAQEIRTAYLKFFEERGHKVIPRARIVPDNDPTTLFTGSGMQPLLPYLLGEKHPAGTRVVDSQTCFRAEDIDEVGDNRHTTFFEMLGNWSFGDYFKKEQLPWLFEFLVEKVGLDPTKLYVTCFIGDEKLGIPKDTEASQLWKKLFKTKDIDAKTVDVGPEATGYEEGMQGGRVFFYDGKKNWWSRGGPPETTPIGDPCGPDSEVFYDCGTDHDPKWGKQCHPNCDCGRFIEIANSVFMAYKRTKDGFEELPKPNVDFGGGLERLAAAAIDSSDMFKISVIWPIIEEIEKLGGKKYDDYRHAMQVIADHMRSAVFMAADGVTPSNKTQGYVLRRLLRRAIRYGLELDIEHGLLEAVAETILDIYKEPYPELLKDKDIVVSVLEKEEKAFRQTLRKGLREFEKLVDKQLDGKTVFTLFDTFGFPPELSVEEAKHRSIAVDDNWQKAYKAELEKQRLRSRTAAAGLFKGGLAEHNEQTIKYHTATHMMYKALRIVLGKHVMQRGSNITNERLRFDFSHSQKMTQEEIKQVETIVNENIEKDLKVSWQEVLTKEALKQGAFGAFGDKYGDKVKVYSMAKEGEQPYSFEICGGPHVEHTGLLGEGDRKFKIIKEESSAAGIRRIKAVLG